MFNSIKDRAVYYPFMPTTVAGVLPLVSHIRDLRVVLPGYLLSTTTIIRVSSITETEIVFAAGNEVFTVPVYTGVDTYPATESYMLVDDDYPSYIDNHAPQTAVQNALRPHPDCLYFYTTAPVLSIQKREGLTTSDTATQTNIALNGPKLRIQNGYNVMASWNGGVLLTGIEGGGAGKVPSSPSPFTDRGSALVYTEEKGLRSINGTDGAVTITGYSDVLLDTETGTQIVVAYKEQS